MFEWDAVALFTLQKTGLIITALFQVYIACHSATYTYTILLYHCKFTEYHFYKDCAQDLKPSL